MTGNTKIQAYSLDYLYENEKIIENIGYIHLDVEGMEFLVISGANKLIDIYKPIITFEQHINSEDYGKIVRHLNGKNYIVYLINEILPGCYEDCRNFIAFPQDIHYEHLIQNIENYCNRNNLLLLQK